LHGNLTGELGSPAYCKEVVLFLDLVVLRKVSAGFGAIRSGKLTLNGTAVLGEKNRRRKN